MIDELREELYMYNLLRHVFLREPQKEFIQGILTIDLPPYTADQISYGLRLMADSAKKNSQRLDDWTEELAVEYTRLFIGPKNPPALPYASFYLSESRSLMTDETINVRRAYLDAGMAVKELHSIPDDHVGIELEFIYYLTQKTLELFEQGQREEASRLFEIRSNFIEGHMALWIPFFVEKVIESTREDFYKGAAFMLKACV